MDVNPEQLHGCDVEKLKSDNPYRNNFTFTHLYNEKESYSLPYEDASCDVILALMSLHHIPNKRLMLDEIKRILKPGGLFIIREHDCVSNGLGLVLDVVHGFYSMVWANPREMEDFDTLLLKKSQLSGAYPRLNSLIFSSGIPLSCR